MIEEPYINSIEQLCAAVVAGVDLSQYGDVKMVRKGDLVKLCYTSRAAQRNRWNWLERSCRGIIINSVTGEVVARPFDKFFGWGEGGRTTTAPLVDVTTKVDGSLGILHWEGNEPHITTKGSFDSEQAQWATDHFRRAFFSSSFHCWPEWARAYTACFEIVYPGNRIVVDYGDTARLVLIGLRHLETGKCINPWSTMIPATGVSIVSSEPFTSAQEIIDFCATSQDEIEGFVATFADGSRFKFKTARYLARHRATFGLNLRRVAELYLTAEDGYEAVKDAISCAAPHARPTLEGYLARVMVAEKTCEKKFRRAINHLMFMPDDRKARAIWIQRHGGCIAPVLFAWLSNKSCGDAMAKVILAQLKEPTA